MLAPIVGCKKYDEGPRISLASAKHRLAQTWLLESARDIATNADITALHQGLRWRFTKDGKFEETVDFLISGLGGWSFIREKEAVQITIPGNSTDIRNYTIIRLKKKELKVTLEGEEFTFSPG